MRFRSRGVAANVDESVISQLARETFAVELTADTLRDRITAKRVKLQGISVNVCKSNFMKVLMTSFPEEYPT